jgi:hypothetical protein
VEKVRVGILRRKPRQRNRSENNEKQQEHRHVAIAADIRLVRRQVVWAVLVAPVSLLDASVQIAFVSSSVETNAICFQHRQQRAQER